MTIESPVLRTAAVGVVVPAHNEHELLVGSLRSVVDAFEEVSPWGATSKLMVVLDACSDDSEDIARELQTVLVRDESLVEMCVVKCRARNVGYARGLGCSALLAQWSRLPPSKIWIATTDADSRVPLNWLAAQVLQHEAGAEHWFGRVEVTDWSEHRHEARLRWQTDYEQESRPIHGASLGFNAAAYLAAGGFKALKTGEDRALHRALINQGGRAHYDSATRVVTSARRRARAPYGFAHALDLVNSSLRLDATS